MDADTQASAAEVVDPDALQWDEEVDVAVVGLGGAGVCAALQAMESGARVMGIDRFGGGGATAISGGIVYAGGGTRHQLAADFDKDSPDNMFAYLQQEVGDAVPQATLRRFCDDSVSNLEWLEHHGARFDSAFCPYKTSYPLDRYTLYYSGNEGFAPYRDHAVPVPRGHRPVGKGLPGSSLYEPLRRSAEAMGVITRYRSRVTKLFKDAAGRVIGLEMQSIKSGSFAALRHELLHRAAKKIAPAIPKLAVRMRAAIARIEAAHSRPRRVRVLRGTVLSAGGFIMNRPMVEKYAPTYRPGIPLGHTGCDGSGIHLGMGAGAQTDRLDQVSAWRFINPPMEFPKGMLVNRGGERYINEMLYGAAVGKKMVQENEGQAILIHDERGFREARAQSGPGKAQWFQWVPALLNLYSNCKHAPTIEALAKMSRIDPDGLRATLDRYNAAADGDAPDEFGKDVEHMRRLEPPFIAINCSIDSRRFLCPTLTLGGLVVDGETGQVKGDDGGVVEGLFSAGRNAVGISSENYVSGLSIADCVFSGRRAGKHAAEGVARGDAVPVTSQESGDCPRPTEAATS